MKEFLKVNVLIFSDELGQAAHLLMAADQAGVDALIVQNLGLCLLATALVPSLSLHASTQMTIMSAAGVAQAAVAGCVRGVLHQHIPFFIWSTACSVRSYCGRPCDQHTLMLRDQSGVEHPLKADLGCRTTLFKGKPQTGVEALNALLSVGIKGYCLDLLDEDAKATRRRVQLYSDDLLDGTLSANVREEGANRSQTRRYAWQFAHLQRKSSVTSLTLR